MKHIGLIGGLSPESTVEYYKMICAEFNQKFDGLNFPEITIRSINLQEMLELFKANRWDKVSDKIVAAVSDLRNAGADFAAITANTPHNAYDRIREQSSLELVSIMDATAKAIKNTGISNVALLGTKPTMEYGFFQKTFDQLSIQTMIPGVEERNFLDRIIWEELSHGIIKEDTGRQTGAIIEELVGKGAEGIVLGCTELPLLIQSSDVSVPLFNTTKIHAEAILSYACG